jgi:hypothetical protein
LCLENAIDLKWLFPEFLKDLDSAEKAVDYTSQGSEATASLALRMRENRDAIGLPSASQSGIVPQNSGGEVK